MPFLILGWLKRFGGLRRIGGGELGLEWWGFGGGLPGRFPKTPKPQMLVYKYSEDFDDWNDEADWEDCEDWEY